MKNRFHHILILTFMAATAAAYSTYAQDHGVTEFEITDSEKDRVERDRILYSPGEGDTRYNRSTSSTTPAVTNATKEPAVVKETAKDQDVPAKPAAPATKQKQETQPAKNPEKPQPAKGHDDEILSFNFLYYIIQKYKLQDIID